MQLRSVFIIFLLMMTSVYMNAQQQTGHYAPVNGLQLYYEVHGSGYPLVLLHGGGSTIESNYGGVLPMLAKEHQVIAIELQAHGHTKDIDRPLSFEQDADDVAALLKQLKIEKADIMGFSNGATTALQMGIRHPELVNRLVLVAALYKRDGVPAGFFEGFSGATLNTMPKPLQAAYLKANPDQKGLEAMFHRDVARMMAFKDISDADIKSIQAPAFVIGGDADVIQPRHTLQLAQTLPHAKLAILPGGHGECLAEVCTPQNNKAVVALTMAMISEFLR
ncbi:alpha/beta hydrolase [Chitinophaga sp. 212800010-3]|uniref:alpha/beta fold hydrolase n=1 Tax=unclassified Chitinophaga TaxID=2619133 RepID=UPI002DE967A0|nr:Alpha/beta hydrolase fold protein [Chitinophaga sp. 212800010-3]